MAGMFSRKTLKHLSIAFLLIMMCCSVLYFQHNNVDQEQQHWEERKFNGISRPGKWVPSNKANKTASRTFSVAGFGSNKALSVHKPVLVRTLFPKSMQMRRSYVYGECYRYSKRGIERLPIATLARNHCKKRLPKAMVIGVKKCGTMTLQLYLQLHPSIAINGEILFPIGTTFTAKDVENWQKEMPFSSPHAIPMIESSGYLQAHVESQLRLKPYLDDNVKIIVIIRDPVTRAISDYVHQMTVILRDHFNGGPPPDLEFSMKYQGDYIRNTFRRTVFSNATGEIRQHQHLVANGRYVQALRRLMEVYKRDQLLILDGQAFIEDPLPIMRQAEKFLGVPEFFKRSHFRRNTETGFYCAHVPERPHVGCANPKIKGRSHPDIEEDTLQMLRDYYRPFNRELAKEFDLDFPWLFQ